MTSAFLIFSDVAGSPKVRMELPLVRLGDRLELRFRIQRQNGGRTEELHVAGEFKVTSLVLDTTRGRTDQVIEVSASGIAPVWRAIKNARPSRFPIKGLKVPAKH